LEARRIEASGGNLESEVTGEVEVEGNVLILRRIKTLYKLRAPEAQREVIKRIHEIHADHCPVARSLKGAIEIQTCFELVP
jgi:uncharacterized OsmC-like protein